jgi:hypothetical protein
MEPAQIKNEMLEVMGFAQGELSALIEHLAPEEKSARGSLKKWSAKDMLFHLAFWNNHLNAQIEKGLKGEKVPQPGDYLNQVNDGVLFEHIDQPFEEAQSEVQDAYQKMLDITADLSAGDLSDLQKYKFLEGRSLLDRILGTYGYHVAAHISDHYIQSGKLEKARALQEKLSEKLSAFPTWKANSVYNLACFYALNGMGQEAIEKLKVAFKERPELLEWSKQDSDMDPLREMPEYQALFK